MGGIIGQVCSAAAPFCSGSYLFPNVTGTTAQSGPDYACLYSQPSPVWYYMEISTAGPMEMNISQNDVLGNGLDVDFALWGPFTNTSTACSQISAGTALPIQSSYSASSVETIAIGTTGGSNSICDHGNGETTPPNAAVGQIYVAMITNYADDPGFISFSQTGGTGAANCAIVVLSSPINFTGEFENNKNKLSWELFGEQENITHYNLLSSIDGKKWQLVKKIVQDETTVNYNVLDERFVKNKINYYKLQSFNKDGVGEESDIISIDNRTEIPTLIKKVNLMGQEINDQYTGLVIYIYSDGSTVKQINNTK